MLRHRTLPVVIDYFVEDSSCYLVMQFIEGEDLAAHLRRHGACPEKDVQRWAAEVLAALVYLHGLETPVIHRDIKPANIKLTPRGDVVLLDFGLAKGAPGSETRPADDDQSIYGFTPNYAPPEQLQVSAHRCAKRSLRARCDAVPPGDGWAPPSAVDRSAAIGLGRPDPLIGATTSATVSEPFAALLRRAMAIEPVARFASASEMLRALTSPSPGNDTEPARPHGLFASPPPVRPAARARRLDAATPSRAELDRAVDLLVQIRFADSPLLGLEDWPTRRKPDRIEQASEPVKIEHAVDPATGRFLPARLRIKLVAPDFEIRGASEQLIDVAPDEYSQRVAFLMTPRRTGFSRVNVEVYAADTVYLGAIAMESEVVAEGVQQAPLCTADLVLNVAEAEAPLVDTTVIVRELADPPTAMVAPVPASARPASAVLRSPSAQPAPPAAIATAAAALVIESPHLGAGALGCRGPDGGHSGAAVAEHLDATDSASSPRDSGRTLRPLRPRVQAGARRRLRPSRHRHRSRPRLRRRPSLPLPGAVAESIAAAAAVRAGAGPCESGPASGSGHAACATERRARRCLELVTPRRAAARGVDRTSERKRGSRARSHRQRRGGSGECRSRSKQDAPRGRARHGVSGGESWRGRGFSGDGRGRAIDRAIDRLRGAR